MKKAPAFGNDDTAGEALVILPVIYKWSRSRIIPDYLKVSEKESPGVVAPERFYATPPPVVETYYIGTLGSEEEEPRTSMND